jgi:hypothetical protein
MVDVQQRRVFYATKGKESDSIEKRTGYLKEVTTLNRFYLL